MMMRLSVMTTGLIFGRLVDLFVDHIKRMLTLNQLFQPVPQRRPDQRKAGKAEEVRRDSRLPVVTGQVYLLLQGKVEGFDLRFIVSESCKTG